MRSSLVVPLLSLLAILPSIAEEPAAVVSTIREVTVYSDRARVTRVGAVPLAAGSTALAFRGLPGWTDEGSVRVAVAQ